MPITSIDKGSLILNRVFYQARLHPSHVAVLAGPREITYSEFLRDIEAASKYLSTVISTKPNLVAVVISDEYLHWLAVLSLLKLRWASVSFAENDLESLSSTCPDVVLTDRDLPSSSNNVLFNHGCFIRSDYSNDEFAKCYGSREDLIRVQLSSGTTGSPKKIGLTEQLLDRRIRNIAFTYDINSRTRFLCTVPIMTICGFHLPLATWGWGGVVVMGPHIQGVLETVIRTKTNLMFLSPVALVHLIKHMPSGIALQDDLTVFVGGGYLPYEVNCEARKRLTPHLFIIYGSTEASVTAYAHASIADKHVKACGFVLPFAEVQVVDQSGLPVQAGVSGEIRIRSEGCVSAYLDDAPLSAAVFNDDWFYPGDIGFVDEQDVLHISGRSREIMNLGGFKISPNLIEDWLRNVHGVADIAVFSITPDHGIELLYVFVVPDLGFNLECLVEKYKTKFNHLPEMHMIMVSALPRNSMGKVDTKILHRLAENA